MLVRHDIPLDDAIAVVAAVGTSDDETEAVLMAAFTASIADGRMHLLDGRQPWKHLPTCSGFEARWTFIHIQIPSSSSSRTASPSTVHTTAWRCPQGQHWENEAYDGLSEKLQGTFEW